MEPWYKVVTPRKEVREGRSFNPDEFAIALEQVVAGTAPEDYCNPEQFFKRTCFTRALRENAGMALRRLAGKTENTAPALTLITQFGGGKTHTLTALYHLARNGEKASNYIGVSKLLKEASLSIVPEAQVAVFIGNAWDPQEGRETPWIDIARQLAGDKGITELGPAAKTTPPGTEAILRVFKAANSPVLILMDEVLNFFNRHRNLAEHCYAFFDNLCRAMMGTIHGAVLISLPRSQVEMTDWDLQWQDRITKVVRRVAKDLIVNDEAEISEVVRRRLFEDLGGERTCKSIAKVYADWCYERRAQLPSEWTAVDTASTESKAREFLRSRFEVCYPFHPATLSVFQRKWQALTQYQQTRGTLAMLAQWISWAYRESYQHARREPLITLGSAPLEVLEFRSVILGQLGEPKLIAAIETDISGTQSHARALDADTKGPLRDIHRRTATAILFESSGGQKDKMAHLPELRFALGEPEIDTTSIDTAALALESRAFFIRKVGTDGFQIRHQPTLRKAVNDRRASLDYETEIKPTMRSIVQKEFERGASIPLVFFPEDSVAIQDSPRLTLVIMEPECEWRGNGTLRQQIAEWTRQRGKTPRLYPGSLIWCMKKPGRELREKVELWLAWKRVSREIAEGTLGGDFDRTDRAEIQSSSSETLCGRVISALKSGALLNESIGAGYIDRNWPPALKDIGAWSLTSIRQSFLNGSLTRLLDPDAIVRGKIIEFVGNGDFGLASGQKPDGTYERVWYMELISPEEVAFESDVFLLKKDKAKSIKAGVELQPSSELPLKPFPQPEPTPIPDHEPDIKTIDEKQACTLHLAGTIPPEIWNRLGTKILPKLRSGMELHIGIDFKVTLKSDTARSMKSELCQILDDLGLTSNVEIREL